MSLELGSSGPRHSYIHPRRYTTHLGSSPKQLWDHQNSPGPWSQSPITPRCQVWLRRLCHSR